MKTNIILLFLIFNCIVNFTLNWQSTTKQQAEKTERFKKKIKHIVIIYQENWSFDGLYGKFPDSNANTLKDTVSTKQVNIDGTPLLVFPKPFRDASHHIVDSHFLNTSTPTHPYDLLPFLKSETVKTGDLIHQFYTEQRQINNGKMDKFVAWSNNGGLAQSFIDASDLPEGKLAREYTLCDNFFHSAFGGSFLNHIWLIAAATPHWPDAPKKLISDSVSTSLNSWIYDNQVDTDKYVINTTFSINHPRPPLGYYRNDTLNLLPNLTMPTIGDRLNEAHISWAWYAGGWNQALSGKPDESFQYHHQPFIYFEKFKDNSDAKKRQLKDETDFIAAIQNGSLPSVSFIKPLGKNNEHPGYADLLSGQQHVDSLVKLVMSSKYWEETAIVIAYDENGGRWDHVAPPNKGRRWGPGTRVPAIIISPYARRRFIDHTQYETVSILKFIETRFDLKPLNLYDLEVENLLNAFDF